MRTMFANAKGFKLRRNAERRLAEVFKEIPLVNSWTFIISKDDGTYLPVVRLENGETHWLRALIDRRVCVTN